MPSSVFFLLKVSLFALNRFERFDKSFFICFDILSVEFDCMMLVSSSKWYNFEYLMLRTDPWETPVRISLMVDI